MSLSKRIAVLAFAATATVLSRPAAADPVEITSGYITGSVILPNTRVVLNGDGFTLDAFVEGFNSTLSLVCFPCEAGQTVSFAGSFDGPQASGSALVNGVFFPEVFLDGMTGTVSSAPFQLNGAQTLLITRPFTFSGSISGYLQNPRVEGFSDPVFTKEVFGSGTASATFLYNSTDSVFFASDLRYDFGSPGSPEPTPEPATLLLVGTGAAIAARRRRQRGPAPS